MLTVYDRHRGFVCIVTITHITYNLVSSKKECMLLLILDGWMFITFV